MTRKAISPADPPAAVDESLCCPPEEPLAPAAVPLDGPGADEELAAFGALDRPDPTMLDADSFARAAFDEEDARQVESLARRLGLIHASTPPLRIVRL